MTNIPLDGSQLHVTQYDPQLNSRVSWDTNGQNQAIQGLHSTNQNFPYGHPQRHS